MPYSYYSEQVDSGAVIWNRTAYDNIKKVGKIYDLGNVYVFLQTDGSLYSSPNPDLSGATLVQDREVLDFCENAILYRSGGSLELMDGTVIATGVTRIVYTHYVSASSFMIYYVKGGDAHGTFYMQHYPNAATAQPEGLSDDAKYKFLGIIKQSGGSAYYAVMYDVSGNKFIKNQISLSSAPGNTWTDFTAYGTPPANIAAGIANTITKLDIVAIGEDSAGHLATMRGLNQSGQRLQMVTVATYDAYTVTGPEGKAGYGLNTHAGILLYDAGEQYYVASHCFCSDSSTTAQNARVPRSIGDAKPEYFSIVEYGGTGGIMYYTPANLYPDFKFYNTEAAAGTPAHTVNTLSSITGIRAEYNFNDPISVTVSGPNGNDTFLIVPVILPNMYAVAFVDGDGTIYPFNATLTASVTEETDFTIFYSSTPHPPKPGDLKIELYNQHGEDIVFNKAGPDPATSPTVPYIARYADMYGTLRESTSTQNPEFNIESAYKPTANYCKIPAWNKYYFIRDIVSIRRGLWRLICEEDELTSFAGQLALCSGMVRRQEKFYTPGLPDDLPMTGEVIVTEIEATSTPFALPDLLGNDKFPFVIIAPN